MLMVLKSGKCLRPLDREARKVADRPLEARITDESGMGLVQVLLLGDERQTIYEFRGADARYLTHCQQTFPSALPWTGKTPDYPG